MDFMCSEQFYQKKHHIRKKSISLVTDIDLFFHQNKNKIRDDLKHVSEQNFAFRNVYFRLFFFWSVWNEWEIKKYAILSYRPIY